MLTAWFLTSLLVINHKSLCRQNFLVNPIILWCSNSISIAVTVILLITCRPCIRMSPLCCLVLLYWFDFIAYYYIAMSHTAFFEYYLVAYGIVAFCFVTYITTFLHSVGTSPLEIPAIYPRQKTLLNAIPQCPSASTNYMITHSQCSSDSVSLIYATLLYSANKRLWVGPNHSL